MESLDLAILFWFYTRPDVCRNRFDLLKRFNPNARIYGLYGGPLADEPVYRETLKALDAFHTVPSEDSFWKWVSGDLALLEWFRSQGRELPWDSVVIAQWDMLAFEPFEHVFRGIREDQFFLPRYAYRSIVPEFESRWFWTSEAVEAGIPDDDKRKPYLRNFYLRFRDHVRDSYGFTEPLPYGLFYIAVLPRTFFEGFSAVKDPSLGFLEYKMPTYAKIFGLDRFEVDLGERVEGGQHLNAAHREISEAHIRQELSKEFGWRVFHPFFQVFASKA